MRTHALNPQDLSVESFATSGTATSRPAAVDATTKWPMDCPETLPQFCVSTSLC
jgi:hypothetical protein